MCESVCTFLMRFWNACCRYAILITSTTATKAPKPKVTRRMIFCFRGNLMDVSIGNGRNRIARSVIGVLKAAFCDSLASLCPSSGFGFYTRGLHCAMFNAESARPPTLTMNRVA